MQVTIHAAFITDGKHTLEIVSASHDDLIARIGGYCLQHWASVSSGPPPENLKVLVDAYFASADASIEFTREQPDLPEPYASATRMLACLESLLAAQSAYKPGDGEALAVLCSEILDARKVVAKASSTLIPVVPTFTVFCQEASGQGTIHIVAVEAANLEDAITAGKQQCIDDWSTGPDDTRWNMETVHCLGVASGDVEILHWQDQPE
jgi:hypothetical protein